MKYSVILLILCSACFLKVEKTPIQTPKIDRSYYQNSIEVLEEAIEDQPDYTPFIELQLSYYERLGWPPQAGDAISRAEKYLLNNQKFFNQKIAYYRANDAYDQLVQTLLKYPVASQLPLPLQLTYTDALIQMGDSMKAREQLTMLKHEKADSSVLEFLIAGNLLIGDTTEAIALLYEAKDSYLNKLLELYEHHNMWDSVISLFALDPKLFSKQPAIQLVAEGYLAMDSLLLAEQLLKSDSSIAGQLMLVEVYERQYKLLSATRVMDQLIMKKPNEIKWLKKRGALADRRGFYESAMYYFGQAIKIDSTDQEAILQLDEIRQKIAYLRQQQQEQQIMPMLGVDSLKKGMNN